MRGHRGGRTGGRGRAVGLLAVLLSGAAVLTACATTVDGSGSQEAVFPSGTYAQPSGQTPTQSGGGATVQPTTPTTTSTGDFNLSCPHVSIPGSAKLAFDCLVPGMTQGTTNQTWIYNWAVNTEPTWEASEGVSPGTSDLTQSLTSQLQDLIDGQFYGPNATHTTPTITATTVGGKKAGLLETTFTVAPAYRKQKSLKVVTEKLWMLAIAVDTADSTLWYVSVPDTIRQYWAKVPALIKGIKVIG